MNNTIQLHMQILSQLHSSHMGVEKTRLLVCKSVYWVNMNATMENEVKHCATCLEYQKTQPQEKTTSYEVLAKPWEVVGADIFMIKNEIMLCIVDYYSKFLVVKKMLT